MGLDALPATGSPGADAAATEAAADAGVAPPADVPATDASVAAATDAAKADGSDTADTTASSDGTTFKQGLGYATKYLKAGGDATKELYSLFGGGQPAASDKGRDKGSSDEGSSIPPFVRRMIYG